MPLTGSGSQGAGTRLVRHRLWSQQRVFGSSSALPNRRAPTPRRAPSPSRDPRDHLIQCPLLHVKNVDWNLILREWAVLASIGEAGGAIATTNARFHV